jgi:hypothetical protein
VKKVPCVEFFFIPYVVYNETNHVYTQVIGVMNHVYT